MSTNNLTHLTVQEGGTSYEWYTNMFESAEEAEEHRTSCDRGSYRTTGVFEIPACLVQTDEQIGALTELLDEVIAACVHIEDAPPCEPWKEDEKDG